MDNEQMLYILEKELYFHNKNLTKKQFHALDDIREELISRIFRNEKRKEKALLKLQKELGGNK